MGLFYYINKSPDMEKMNEYDPYLESKFGEEYLVKKINKNLYSSSKNRSTNFIYVSYLVNVIRIIFIYLFW